MTPSASLFSPVSDRARELLSNLYVCLFDCLGAALYMFQRIFAQI